MPTKINLNWKTWKDPRHKLYQLYSVNPLESLDPNYRKAFLRFCVLESSLENALCWLCMRDYHKRPTFDKALALLKVFMVQGAPLLANVSQSTVQQVANQVVGAGQLQQNPPVSANLFDPLQSELTVNLNDTIFRFTSLDLGHEQNRGKPVDIRSKFPLAVEAPTKKRHTHFTTREQLQHALWDLNGAGFDVQRVTGMNPFNPLI